MEITGAVIFEKKSFTVFDIPWERRQDRLHPVYLPDRKAAQGKNGTSEKLKRKGNVMDVFQWFSARSVLSNHLLTLRP